MKITEQSGVHAHFQTPMAYYSNTDLIGDLKSYIYSLEGKGIESNVAPLVKHNLVESNFDFFNDNSVAIAKTKSFLVRSLTRTLNELHSEDECYQIIFRDSWFHVGKTNSLHEVHRHSQCSWCGIYYVDIGDVGSGQTRFINPNYSAYDDMGTRWLDDQTEETIEIENGLLILFPSYLEHYQSLYTGKKDRIVVAFNAQVHF